MSYSLNSLKGDIWGTTIGDIKGDTRSLDYSSYRGYRDYLGVRAWVLGLGYRVWGLGTLGFRFRCYTGLIDGLYSTYIGAM